MKITLTIFFLWLSWFIIKIISIEINHCRKSPRIPLHDQFSNELARAYAAISNGNMEDGEKRIFSLSNDYPDHHEDIADLRQFLHERKQQL